MDFQVCKTFTARWSHQIQFQPGGTNLTRGTCGIRPLTLFDKEGYRSQIAAEVEHDRLLPLFTPLQRRRWSRGDHFGVHAAREALR